MRDTVLKVMAVSFFASIVTTVYADDLTNNFRTHLNERALDVLAKDLGAVMGGGSFHQGKALGFPLGFDLGVHVPVVKIQSDNDIIKDDTSRIGVVWGQAEIGLPARINLIGRIGKVLDADLVGGGLRLGLFNSSVPGIPSFSVSGLYSELDHDFLQVKTVSANAVLSFDVPFIHPYVGAGYDHTTLEPTEEAFVGVPASISRDVKGEADGYRAEVGINLSIIPFTYLTIATGLANGESLYHAGAGIKF